MTRPEWAGRDTRLIVQVLGAAIPGAIALGMAVLCIYLASQGAL